MRHRRVFDLMTPTVVSVQRGTTFKEIARLLDEFDITAVPVVDEDDRPAVVSAVETPPPDIRKNESRGRKPVPVRGRPS